MNAIFPVLALTAEDAAGDFRPYLHQQTGDSMEPTLRNRDFSIIVPVDRYMGEGLYLLSTCAGELDIYRCQGWPRGMILAFKDNKKYGRGCKIPHAEFNPMVRGKVFATCNVNDGSLLGLPLEQRIRKAVAA